MSGIGSAISSAFGAASSFLGSAAGSSVTGFLAPVAGSAVSGLFSSREAEKNREFQEMMSNTSYQRAMADMRRAGLNPILAAKLGGASTPAGAMANIPDLGMSLSSAMSGQASLQQAEVAQQKMDAEIEQIKSQTGLNEQQGEVLKETIPKIRAEIEGIKARAGLQSALTAIPQLVSDLVEAIRSIGAITDAAGLQDKLTIVIRKDATDYEEQGKPWFRWEYNKERQLQ